MKKVFLILLLMSVAGCVVKDFDYGLGRINKINLEYNTTMDTYPTDVQKIDSMTQKLSDLKSANLENGNEQFLMLINYRILNLEAEKLYLLNSQKYGNSGTTKLGFGCKQRPLIIESVALRNNSALKGFEAVNLLYDFLAKYPEEAKSANLSVKNALFSNATFYQIYSDARKDSNVINSFCTKARVLELYQEELRKRTNLSEDYINNLDYEAAVKIWKKTRGLE